MGATILRWQTAILEAIWNKPVIPAEAGISEPFRSACKNREIPAFAGMTVGEHANQRAEVPARRICEETVFHPYLRRRFRLAFGRLGSIARRWAGLPEMRFRAVRSRELRELPRFTAPRTAMPIRPGGKCVSRVCAELYEPFAHAHCDAKPTRPEAHSSLLRKTVRTIRTLAASPGVSPCRDAPMGSFCRIPMRIRHINHSKQR